MEEPLTLYRYNNYSPPVSLSLMTRIRMLTMLSVLFMFCNCETNLIINFQWTS